MSPTAATALLLALFWTLAPLAAFADEWRFVGFDEAGRYAFFDRASSRDAGECAESSRVVFRTGDGLLEVRVPTQRTARDAARWHPVAVIRTARANALISE